MTAAGIRSRGMIAVVVASVAASLLGFVILVVSGELDFSAMRDPVTELPVIAAILLIWVPAFAFVPAAILGWLVERPKSRAMIDRRAGGLLVHLFVSIAAALLLWLLFRAVLLLSESTPRLMDSLSLLLVGLVGLCSGIAWWFLVVEPGRRE